ncbi:MAG: hypothetical protein COB48_00340, partial [Pseudoalteromonas sp.]
MVSKIKSSCQLNINSKEWFQARCREARRCPIDEIPLSRKAEAQKACTSSEGSIFCQLGNKGKKEREVGKEWGRNRERVGKEPGKTGEEWKDGERWGKM